jgi:5'-methylthioadenosine phosphorylase
MAKFTLGYIGGSFAHELLAEGRVVGQRLGELETPFGRSQTIYRCQASAGEYYLLLRHSDGAVPLASSYANHRANIYALKDLGVTHVISASAVRAVSHNYLVGQFSIVSDLIDETRTRAGSFFEHGAIVELRQWPVFCPTLRKLMAEAMTEMNLRVTQRGTYLCSEGPRRETPAEVHKYAMWGADLLGHSFAPETFLAKELQMCYAGLCYIVDYAETGSEHRPFQANLLFGGKGGELTEHPGRRAMRVMPEIVDRVLKMLTPDRSECACQDSQRELIEKGGLSKDFRTWFRTLGVTSSDRPKVAVDRSNVSSGAPSKTSSRG